MKIAVTGPESTGKSWLCRQLQQHYGAVLVDEYAREYFEHHPSTYTADDVLAIGKEQYRRITAAMNLERPMIIADTEMLVMSIWFHHKYGFHHPQIEKWFHQQTFDLYLLCDTDLPWEEDPLREHPHLRTYFSDLYHERILRSGVPYGIVRGLHQERLQCAIDHIENFRAKLIG